MEMDDEEYYIECQKEGRFSIEGSGEVSTGDYPLCGARAARCSTGRERGLASFSEERRFRQCSIP